MKIARNKIEEKYENIINSMYEEKKKERIAIIDGLRSPIAKANGKLADVNADILGSIIAKELVIRNNLI